MTDTTRTTTRTTTPSTRRAATRATTRPVTTAGLALAALLLAGCGAPAAPDPTSARGDAASAPAGSAAAAPDSSTDGGSSGALGTDPTDPAGTSGSESPGSDSPGSETSASPGDGGDDTSTSGVLLEVPTAPEEPEAEVSSLAELLPAGARGPLVRTPLPRAASARGRLVRGYPAVLRPTRASTVATSSVSPSSSASGRRLQVGLVASTRLSPTAVLLAFRTRLGARGLLERPAPAAAAGTTAAAFSTGRSTVTLTVTDRGARTTYVLHATLRAEG